MTRHCYNALLPCQHMIKTVWKARDHVSVTHNCNSNVHKSIWNYISAAPSVISKGHLLLVKWEKHYGSKSYLTEIENRYTFYVAKCRKSGSGYFPDMKDIISIWAAVRKCFFFCLFSFLFDEAKADEDEWIFNWFSESNVINLRLSPSPGYYVSMHAVSLVKHTCTL